MDLKNRRERHLQSMECPTEQELKLFICDPDALLCESPEFEDHLAICKVCQTRIDRLVGSVEPAEPLRLVIGDRVVPKSAFPSIDGYQFLESIGSGGFGSVYRATQISTGRSVAIKITPAMDSEHARRASIELDALLRSNHPNIVSLVDLGYQDGFSFVVYPWMEQSLSTYIKNNPVIEVDIAVSHSIAIGKAVVHLHAIGLIHRDIKPSNVLLGASGHPKLSDFGIAKDLNLESPTTTATHPIGTPGYMAPEQTGLTDERVCFATDIYGLGALLYALLTGRPPYLGGNSLRIIQQVIRDEPIPVCRLRSDIPTDLQTICTKCLNKAIGDRYASAQAFVDDLERFKQGHPIHAKPRSLAKQAFLWLHRNPAARTAIISSGLFVAILLAAGWIARQQWRLGIETRAIHAKLDQLRSANSSELEGIYESIEASRPQLLTETCSQIELPNDPGTRLRLRCVSPLASELTGAELLLGITECPLGDLVPLLDRIGRAKLPDVHSVAEPLRKELEKAKQSQLILRVAAALGSLEIDGDATESRTNRITKALTERPENERPIWQNALRPLRDKLTNALLDLSQTQDARTLESSASAFRIALTWNSNNPIRQLDLLERAPTSVLSYLIAEREYVHGSLSQLAIERRKSIKRSMETTNTELTPEFKTMLDRYRGLASKVSGILLRIPTEHEEVVFREIKRNSFAPTSFQEYVDTNQKYFAITFERSDDSFRVTRAVVEADIDKETAKQQSDGFTPVSIYPHDDGMKLDVLWRKSNSILGKIRHEETSMEVRMVNITADLEPNRIRSMTTHQLGDANQTYSIQTEQNLRTYNEDSVLEQRNIYRRSCFGQISWKDRCATNHSSGKSSIQLVHMFPVGPYLLRAEELLRLNAKPLDTFFDPDTQEFGGFWDWNRDSENDSNHVRFVYAMISWLSGDDNCVLEEIRPSRFPDVRTRLIANLCQFDVSKVRVQNLLQRKDLLPDQTYSLLVAISKWNWQEMSDQETDTFRSLLQKLSVNKDSGVQAAAQWLLETKLQFHVELPQVASDPEPNHRSCYVSPLGIKFVVIDPRDIQLISNRAHAPLGKQSEGNLLEFSGPIAVSATEIPEELFQMFLREFRISPSMDHSIDHSNLRSPATGYAYEVMLRFCRWLSEKEGIANDAVGLLSENEFAVSSKWNQEILEKDDYRLPTEMEWEVMARCGTFTSSFLGDSLDTLSDYAWNTDNTNLKVEPVGLLAPSPWGMHDVLGNVFEMTFGEGNNYGLQIRRQTQNYRLIPEMYVSVRGGSYLSNRVYCSSGARNLITVQATDRNVGFRIVRTLKRTTPESTN